MNVKEAIAYLKNMQENWKAFCEGHKLTAEAISVVIAHIEKLEKLEEDNDNGSI